MSSLPEPGTWHLEPHFLLHAQRLAARGLGRTCPNPTVGCVIVKDGAIVGAARTADGGRPHAEALALTMAGEKARGATAYVTLEPCAHHGQTPPCAEALIAAADAALPAWRAKTAKERSSILRKWFDLIMANADDLAQLPFAVGLSRSSSRIIKQNLWVSLGVVVVLIPATIFGLGIATAILFHEGSTLVVVANALRLLAYRGKPTTRVT